MNCPELKIILNEWINETTHIGQCSLCEIWDAQKFSDMSKVNSHLVEARSRISISSFLISCFSLASTYYPFVLIDSIACLN